MRLRRVRPMRRAYAGLNTATFVGHSRIAANSGVLR